MLPIRDLKDITSFTLPEECVTVEQCNRLIDICVRRRGQLAKLSNIPGKRAALKAWDAKVHAVKLIREKLIQN